MTGRHFPECRPLGPAARLGDGAARMEVATGGWVDRARHIAGHAMFGARQRRIGQWHGGEQRLGVRVQRAREQRCLVGVFDDAPEIHHRHAMADMFDDREIMRHEQV